MNKFYGILSVCGNTAKVGGKEVLNYQKYQGLQDGNIVEATILCKEYVGEIKKIPLQDLVCIPGEIKFILGFSALISSGYYRHPESGVESYPFNSLETGDVRANIIPGAEPGIYKENWYINIYLPAIMEGTPVVELFDDGTYVRRGATLGDIERFFCQIDPSGDRRFKEKVSGWLREKSFNDRKALLEGTVLPPDGIKIEIQEIKEEKFSGYYHKTTVVGGGDGWAGPAREVVLNKRTEYSRKDLVKVVRIILTDERGHSFTEEYEELLQKGEEQTHLPRRR